jgi:hypothetical protein
MAPPETLILREISANPPDLQRIDGGLAVHPGGLHENHRILGAIAVMTEEEEREFRAQLAKLQQEHRDLDLAILALIESPGSDLIQVQRLKKRKLVLRDRISYIEDQLTPDIIA